MILTFEACQFEVAELFVPNHRKSGSIFQFMPHHVENEWHIYHGSKLYKSNRFLQDKQEFPENNPIVNELKLKELVSSCPSTIAQS